MFPSGSTLEPVSFVRTYSYLPFPLPKLDVMTVDAASKPQLEQARKSFHKDIGLGTLALWFGFAD